MVIVVKPQTHMLYASAKMNVVQQCEVTKVHDCFAVTALSLRADV
jgi:hypothetical protein